MPRLATAALIALLAARSSLGAQRSDDIVARHRAVYATIERERAGYRHASASTDTLGLERQSTDGGDLDAYCERDTVRLFVANYYGETGDVTDQFYFDRDSLVFVLETSRRGRPNGRDPYPKRTMVEQERLYFTGDRLVRWLGARNVSRPVTSSEARQRSRHVLSDVRRFKAVMPACRPKYAPE